MNPRDSNSSAYRLVFYGSVIVLNLALVFLFDAEIGTTYLARAGLMALGQLLARGAFFAAER